MGGSSSSEGDTTTTVRYAPYIEEKHDAFLGVTSSYTSSIAKSAPDNSFVSTNCTSVFTGVSIANMSNVLSVFNKLTTNTLLSTWASCFDAVVNNEEVDALISAKADEYSTELETAGLASYAVSMRNLNAISSSSFVVGKALLESTYIRKVAEFSSNARISLYDTAMDLYMASLDWLKSVYANYLLLLKSYLTWMSDYAEASTNAKSRTLLWPLTTYTFEGTALGTMQGAMSWRKTLDPADRSALSTTLLVASYGVQGATIGAYFGGYGAVIGAVVGVVVGIAIALFE